MKALTITNKRKTFGFDYKIHKKCLGNADHAKYLGVKSDKKLLWKYYESIIISKANHCRFFLQQNLVTYDQETELHCYMSLTCPTVKYASSVWDPVGPNQLQYQLEQMQRKEVD